MPPNTENTQQSKVGDSLSLTLRDSLQILEISFEKAIENPDYAVVGDSVYDLARFRKVHPGGELFVSLFGGADATNAFLSYHRRSWPKEKMAEFKVANLIRKDVVAEDPLFLKLVERVRPSLKNGGFAPWWYYVKVVFLVGMAMYFEFSMLKNGRTFWGSFFQVLRLKKSSPDLPTCRVSFLRG